MIEEIKKAIVEWADAQKAKTKFYFKDIEKAVKQKLPDAKTMDIKKACTQLINEGTLIYFSTGSTTMYGLKGRGITEDH